MPSPDPAEIQHAIRLHASGQLDQAQQLYNAILARFPDEPNCVHMLGMLYHHRGRNDLAEPLLVRSLELAKRVADFQSNYALVCRATGRLELAERHLRRAIMLNPALAAAHDMLGMVLESRGNFSEAAAEFSAACSANPGFVDAHLHWGLLLWRQERFSEAADKLRRALAIQPQLPIAHVAICAALGRLGGKNLDEAIKHGQIAIQLAPNESDAHAVLACALGVRGMTDQAMAHFNAALQLQPNNVDALTNLAWLFDKLERRVEAVQLCIRATEIAPNHAAALNQLSRSLRWLGRVDEAVSAAQRAIHVAPRFVKPWVNLGSALWEQGDAPAAISAYRTALEITPDDPEIRSNLLLALHYDPTATPQSLLAEHVAYQQICAARFTPVNIVHLNDRNPDRPLRIGYVSPYFRRHAVSTFLEPILRAHDRSRYTVSCYSDVRKDDEVATRLRGYAQHWYETAELSDEDLARLIHKNREDILIDLTGHISGSRLLAFARRPAPVQISYLGYVNTTGLSSMDYRLTDSIADPETADALYTERLLRLPCFFCYEPPADAPPVEPGPAAQNGFITFGSLNHPAKFNPAVLELWAALLSQIPGSRLILNANASGAGEMRLGNLLTSFGLTPDRFELVLRQTWADYLKTYNRIDIALDPFPFGGHTTTCDALWMGVPVLTIAGPTYMGRLTTSVLTHLDLPQFIAADPADFLRRGVSLAKDLPTLNKLRQSLRQSMRDHFTSGTAFVTELEATYRRVWMQWCQAKSL